MEAIIDGTDGKYKITSDGKVISLWNRKGSKEYVRKPIKNLGYNIITIRINGIRLRKKIARLVAHAFIPNPLGLPQVNHINGIRDDNRIENLEWVTNQQNIIHARNNGLLSICKIDMKIADNIRDLYNSGKSLNELRDLYNLSKQNLSFIVRNETWINPNYSYKYNNTGIEKINYKIAEEIRGLYKLGGLSHNDISNRYGISRRSVGNIINKKYWNAHND
jgi:hypothetical protein